MKQKEIRSAQLDSLKDGTSLVTFCVEILNASFVPYKVFCFNTKEEAQAKYDELEPIYYGGFLRKYAVVDF